MELRIVAHVRMRGIYIYGPYVHNPGLHERFYGLDLKKGNGRLGTSLGGR